MTTQCIENNCNQSTDQQNNHRLLKLTPIIFVLAGAVMTVVGNTASLNSCKIVGPVLITSGGLFLLFFTVWHSFRQDPLPETTNCDELESTHEQNLNQVESSIDLQGPIHHFEILRFPSESQGQDVVPPSYEEAVRQ